MQHSVVFDLAREENLTLVLVQVTRLVVMQVRKVDVDLNQTQTYTSVRY